jgi:hypothetical protein
MSDAAKALEISLVTSLLAAHRHFGSWRRNSCKVTLVATWMPGEHSLRKIIF